MGESSFASVSRVPHTILLLLLLLLLSLLLLSFLSSSSLLLLENRRWTPERKQSGYCCDLQGRVVIRKTDTVDWNNTSVDHISFLKTTFTPKITTISQILFLLWWLLLMSLLLLWWWLLLMSLLLWWWWWLLLWWWWLLFLLWWWRRLLSLCLLWWWWIFGEVYSRRPCPRWRPRVPGGSRPPSLPGPLPSRRGSSSRPEPWSPPAPSAGCCDPGGQRACAWSCPEPKQETVLEENPVCLFLCLSFCLFVVCLFICFYVSLYLEQQLASGYPLFVSLSVCLCMFVYLFVCSFRCNLSSSSYLGILCFVVCLFVSVCRLFVCSLFVCLLVYSFRCTLSSNSYLGILCTGMIIKSCSVSFSLWSLTHRCGTEKTEKSTTTVQCSRPYLDRGPQSPIRLVPD